MSAGSSPRALGQPLVPSQARPLAAWAVLFVLCGVAFGTNAIISLIAPFLPQHFESIGVSQIWCGVMFSGFPVAMLVCSPLAVMAMSRVGRVPVLFFGLVLQGATSIVFGYADDLTGGPGVNPTAALVVFAVSRLLCGAGGACANNAIFSITADRFPTSLGKVMGLNEVVIGVGFSLGPPIGSFFYFRGGFGLPFLVAGVAVLAFAPFSMLLRQPAAGTMAPDACQDAAAGAGGGGLFEVLEPGLVVPAFTLLLGTGVFGIVEPILSLYLQNEVGVAPKEIGLVFAVFAFAYSLAGPLCGMLADRAGPLLVCTAGGLCGGLTMAVLMGPLAGSFPKGSFARIAYINAVLIVLGVAQAATLIPSLPAMKGGVTAVGPTVTDRVVAWFNMFMQMGLAIGPLVGTWLVGTVGFEKSVAACGVVIAAYGAFATSFALRRRREAVSPCTTPVARTMSFSITGVCLSPTEAKCLDMPVPI